MNKRVKVFVGQIFAGDLIKQDNGYTFVYDKKYLLSKDASPISLTLPLQAEPYYSQKLFPFFDGLAQEGWLKEMSERILHIDASDQFTLLVKNGRDCVGNISIEEV